MSGGGGGGGAPAGQDNSLQIAQMNADKARRDEQIQRDEAEQAKRLSTDKRLAGRTQAEELGAIQAAGRGIPESVYRPLIQRGLDQVMGNIPENDPNPAQYFGSDVINNILTEAENNNRTGFTNQVNNVFTPGIERRYVPDTADDSYINEILAGQRGEADTSLDFARKRGQLNDFGYSGAQSKLGEQDTSARTTLDSLGNSVLGKARDRLTGVKDKAYAAANSTTLGGPEFDVNPFLQEFGDTGVNINENLKGDLLNALGGTKLFNVNDILLSGSRQQGPQNLTTATPSLVPPKSKSAIDRGLGSGGSF